MGAITNPDSPTILEGAIAGNAGDEGKVLKADDASLVALVAAGVAEVAEGAPGSSLPLKRLYFQTSGGKVVALWLGQKPSAPIKLLDASGTPAEGSVGLAQMATATIEAISKLGAGVWRSRQHAATTVGASAQTGKKFFIANGQTSLVEAAASLGQPWRIGWVAADEAVEHLTTKCKIKAGLYLGAAINATVTAALFKVGYSGEKLVLGEEVAGSSFPLEAGTKTNQAVRGESAEFTMPEDTDYALGCTVSASTTVASGLQARLLVHNT